MADINTSNKKTDGETVSVACKLPHGLVLRIFNICEIDVPVMGGGFKKEKQAQERDEAYVVHGWSHAQNAAPHCTIIGGYAITEGIPKQHWELWLSQNKNSDMVKNHLIFAQNTVASVKDQSKEHAEQRSGLERLDPTKLPKALKTADMMNKEIAAKLAA